jgi:hypothetical protein
MALSFKGILGALVHGERRLLCLLTSVKNREGCSPSSCLKQKNIPPQIQNVIGYLGITTVGEAAVEGVLRSG